MIWRRKGIRFDRFYAAAPVCSPTRASCLTGQHPYRVNIPWAGDGFLPKGTSTIAEKLNSIGYKTGHFGKWHVGGLSKTIKQSYFAGPPTGYAPPWEHGYDICFATESMMPTYNPYYHIGGDFGTNSYRYIQNEAVTYGQEIGGFRWRDYYWTGPGQFVDEWLKGDDSEIIMDQTLNFIEQASQNDQPFFATVWFHAVHTPVVAGDEDRALYPEEEIEAQHWFGTITAMDRQIGRLRKQLQEMELSDNTILWFCSDNGPSYIHEYNSAGPFRGKKSELWEGGICVPAILEWPQKFNHPRVIDVPIVTSDFYPTLLYICGIDSENPQILDGENVYPILEGKRQERISSIGFQSPLPQKLQKQQTVSEEQFAWIDNQFKLLSMDNGDSYQLYNIKTDQGETQDISAKHPEVKARMLKELKNWSESLSINH